MSVAPAFLMLLAAVSDAPPLDVAVGRVFSNHASYLGQRIRLCGYPKKGFRTAKHVFERSSWQNAPFGIDVDESVRAEEQQGGRVCYTGVLRRHDGLSVAELSSAQRYGVVSHVAVYTAYFLATD